jgi:2-iminobutanoate/2-iminopropanoate deaminase
MMIHTINTTKAPAPAGHYAQAVEWRDLIFVSGQLPVHPESTERIPGTITEQAAQALENVKSILEEAGSDLNHVLKVTIYISDIELWGAVNDIYTDFFKGHKPARAIVPVKVLHFGYQIEIEAVAIKG